MQEYLAETLLLGVQPARSDLISSCYFTQQKYNLHVNVKVDIEVVHMSVV